MTHPTEKDALREALHDAVSDVLGRYRDIGVGPERTTFRRDVVEAVLSVIPSEVTDA